MDQGNFEDKIQKKFEGQTRKAPAGIWKNIENDLNAELVSIYAAQQNMYKWVSAAAVLIVVLLLGIIYSSSLIDDIQSEEQAAYNALLSNDLDYDSYFLPQVNGFSTPDLSFDRIEPTQKPESVVISDDEAAEEVFTSYELKNVQKRKPELQATVAVQDIYRYYKVGTGLPARKSKSSSSSEMWAGVEAGAGTFNSSLGESGAVGRSINPGALASAVGSSNFVNPTTNISEEMDQGIATTIGVDFGMKLGRKWTLESGLAYTNMDSRGKASINVLDIYTIDNNFINNSNGLEDGSNPGIASREAAIEVQENYDHEVELNNNVQIASIPLKAGYYVVNKKFSLRLNAGLAANYLVDGSISDPSKEILNSSDLNLYNDWSFDGVGGLEFGYSIFDKFNFTLEPNYRHAITPMSDAVNAPSRFIVQTGLRYTLR